jgi:6-phospho-beta-glucosidase
MDHISVECFGLNHLSWFRSIKINGTERLQDIIKDQRLYNDTEIRMFEPQFVESMGMIPNAYLYYYYYREKALGNIINSGKTRGEVIRDINNMMYEELKNLEPEKDFEQMLCIFLKYYSLREKSYMTIESGSIKPHIEQDITWQDFFDMHGGEGYAGIALNFIDSIVNGVEKEMILSVPNMGSIEGLKNDDVVEISCRVDKSGAHPIHIGSVPEVHMSLIRQVKLYERLAAESIKEKNIDKAVKALMVHPLVNSYSTAKKLAYEYLDAYKDYIGVWR